MNDKLPKGFEMEEALRRYFVQAGYFTLRGVKFLYRGFDVTDVDLWLYSRPSVVSRHRLIVDIKNKKTPQAIERIFWAKGLQETLGMDQAIVATTDRRSDVSEFGKQHGILVLDGNFLARLSRTTPHGPDRISEEEFEALIDSYSAGKLAGAWKTRYRECKYLVLDGLGYDQINAWLSDGRFFAEQAIIVTTHKEVASRILYSIAALIAIGIDFSMRELAFVEQKAKYASIEDGLKFGAGGNEKTKGIVNTAIGLIEQYAPEMKSASSRIKTSIDKEFDSIPVTILAEHFSKPLVSQHLYAVALELEAATFRRRFVSPDELSPEARSVVSVLLDFWDIDRVKFFRNLAGPSQGRNNDQSQVNLL